MSDQIAPEPEINSASPVEDAKSNEVVTESASVETPLEGVSAEETPKEESWVVPNRFKTVDDVVRSYQNLEAEYSRRGNELYQLKQAVKQQSVDPQERLKKFTEAAQKDPVDAIEQVIEKRLEKEKAVQKQMAFEGEYHRLKSYREFADLEPVMVNIAQTNQDLIPEDMRNDPRILHMLFYAAKGLQQEKLMKEAEKKGKVSGETAALRKTKVQVEGGSGSKGNVKRKFEELSLEEMEKELRAGNLG